MFFVHVAKHISNYALVRVKINEETKMQWVWVTFSKSYTSRCQRQDLYPNLPNIKAHALNHKSNCLTLTSLDFYQFTSKPHIIELGCTELRCTSKEKLPKMRAPILCILFCFVLFLRLTLHIYISKFARNSATKKSTWLWLTCLSLEHIFFFLSDSPTNILRTLLPRISTQEVICRILTISSALI